MRTASQVNRTGKKGPLQVKGQPGRSPEKQQQNAGERFLWSTPADLGVREEWCGEGRSWS